jgi:DNA-binding NtrC family response regulator
MKKLLIIDDDDRIRKIIKIQLHKKAVELFDAPNKNSAFEILNREKIDCVICDIKMKDTNGFVILQDIKKQFEDLPVIMLTGFIDKKVSERAQKLGSFDFITKPVRRENLVSTISKAIGDI